MSTDLRPLPTILNELSHSLTAAVGRELERRGWHSGACRVATEQENDPTVEQYQNGTALVRRVYLEWPRPRRLLLVEKIQFVQGDSGFMLKQEIIRAEEREKGGGRDG